jgi:hypothetical protein
MRGIKLISAVALALMLTAVVSATAFAANPEFLPGEKGTKFTGKSGKATLQIKGSNTITCKTSEVTKGNGELLGPKTATSTIDFSTCTAFGLPANSLGDASGIILVKVNSELCYISKAEKTVGIVFTLPSTLHLEVPSTKLLINVQGSFVGKIEPINKKQATYTLVIEQKEGKQAIEKCEGGAALKLETSVDGGAFTQSGEEAKEGTITFEKEQELMA